MPTLEKTLAILERCYAEIRDHNARQRRLRPEAFRNEDDYDRYRKKLDEDIRNTQEEITAALKDLEREPPRFARHFDKLTSFYRDGSHERSVFIMTKFPAPGGKESDQLQVVIDALIRGIEDRGFKARIASQGDHQNWLWDNVELYLLGSSRGVAIIEDRSGEELNPNVAMEWGWMMAMGRDVLYLKEQGFRHERADWIGRIHNTFDWRDPLPGIEAALEKFLGSRL